MLNCYKVENLKYENMIIYLIILRSRRSIQMIFRFPPALIRLDLKLSIGELDHILSFVLAFGFLEIRFSRFPLLRPF